MPQRQQHVGWRVTGRVAGRGRGKGNRMTQRRTVEFTFAEGQAQGVRNALSGATVETYARQAEQLFEQAFTQHDDSFFLVIERLGGQRERCAHAGNLVRRQRPGAQATFMSAAVNLRL
ncbi:hypothetical protein D3C81_1968800 [compost metagenome]